MFKKLNLLFIILFTLIILFIGLFNYIVDPYNVIHTRYKSLHLGEYNKDIIGTILNLSKKAKFNYVVIGSSTTNCFFHRNILNKEKALYMMINQFDVISEVEYLKFILDIHPEITTIIFPVEYAFYFVNDTDRTPAMYHKNLTVKDFSKLLFSTETTTKSIEKAYLFISNLPYSLNEIKEQHKNFPENKNFSQNITDETFEGSNETSVFINRNYSDCLRKPFQKNKYNALNDLKELIEQKNKKIIFIFPPYHALAQAYIYKTNKNNEIQNLKRYIVNNFPESEIIDFSFINKYTAEPLNETYNYRDIVHPQGEPGYLFYCTLKYKNEFKNKGIYIRLTKENLENTINWQDKELEKYINKNDSLVNTFISTPNNMKDRRINKVFSMPENCKYYLDNY